MNRLLQRLLLPVFLLAFASAANAQSVVISQVFGGGGNSGAPYNRDFVELFNRGNASVSLSGMTVQYASATGTGNFSVGATLPNVSLAPGQYYLVGMASGANGAALPTVDVSGTSAMSGTAGKVILANSTAALACNGGSAPCSSAQTALIVDLVGFGTANFFEGTGATPGLSNTTAALRAGGGCTDTNQNASDFTAVAPTPRNTATTLAPCGAPAGPTVSIDDVTLAEGNSGSTNAVFTISLSAAAPVGGVTVNYATAGESATSGTDFTATSGTATIAAGATSTTVSVPVIGDTALEINETFLVTLSGASPNASISDATGIGTITNDDIVITAIGAIQGSGPLSTMSGNLVMTEGVVTGKRSNGFFLQSFATAGDAAIDGNAATSDGIFVYTSTAPTMVAVGNHARVTATVSEFFGSNEMPNTELRSPTVEVLASDIALPAPVEITAAMAGPASEPGTLEFLEGMRVSVANGVVTAPTDGFINESAATSGDSGEFELVVANVPRPHREPGLSIFDDFPTPPANVPYFDANQERLKAFPFAGTALVADAGASISGLVGVLIYFGDAWQVLYDLANPPTIGSAAATAVSSPAADDITVSGFNLQRFFDTVNDPAIGEPVLTPAAFANRLAKTGAAICDWVKSPDILGVVEVENIGTLTDLANHINGNCANAPAYVPYLVEGNDVGGIDVGFLVSNRSVRSGTPRVAVTSVTQVGKDTRYGTSPLGCDPAAAGCTSSLLNDRPSLVLRAGVNFADGRNYPLTVVVNHLRSLNGNDNPTDSRVRYKRAEQALALANLVNDMQVANPSEKIVLVGDFNAFPFNDGYVDSMGIISGNAAPADQVVEYRASPVVTPLVLGDELIADPLQRYSYVFEGNAQSLDHVVVNNALVNDPAVAGLTVEHARINADFRVGHYGEFALPYDAGNPPLRVSDHDPVRLTIGVVRPLSADLGLSWTTNSMSSRGAFTTLTVTNIGTTWISGAQVRIDLEIPPLSQAAVGPPSGWTCQRLGDASFLCTANKALAPGSNERFSVTVRPRTRFAATDSIHFRAQATVVTDPISGDNSVELTLP